MTTINYCQHCRNQLPENSLFCHVCGKRITLHGVSDKSPLVALLLCIFFGSLGIHHFYVDKIGTGLLMLITFGGFGIWTLVDIIVIAFNKFKDKSGNQLKFTASTVKKSLIIIIFSIIAAVAIYFILIFTLLSYALTNELKTEKIQLAT